MTTRTPARPSGRKKPGAMLAAAARSRPPQNLGEKRFEDVLDDFEMIQTGDDPLERLR